MQWRDRSILATRGSVLATVRRCDDDECQIPQASFAAFGPLAVNPYFVRADNATVEVWAGKRIQHGNETRDDWQRALKTELRQVFSRLTIPTPALLAGHYNSTSPIVTDTENSLFTNIGETMPRGAFASLRFERGTGTPPPPPITINLISGHLHYYRYQVGGPWSTWKPAQTLARWEHIPRRLSVGADTARPVWFALRQANADGLVFVSSDEVLEPGTNFGVRITVHTARNGSHQAISNSEFVIDGTIAAFHHDQLSDELVAALLPKLPAVTEHELRHALSFCAGPVFPTPAVQIFENGSVQINPDDDRCWLGEYTVRQDSTTRWPELSGELFTICPIHSGQNR